MRQLLMFLVYIVGLSIWIFDAVFYYGKKILIHIQNHANNGINLDLIYCCKQIGYIIGYGFITLIITYLIMFIIAVKD